MASRNMVAHTSVVKNRISNSHIITWEISTVNTKMKKRSSIWGPKFPLFIEEINITKLVYCVLKQQHLSYFTSGGDGTLKTLQWCV